MFGLGMDDGEIYSVWVIRLKPFKIFRSTSFFIIPEKWNEKTTVEMFTDEIKHSKYGVINAHIGSYDFGNPEETTVDGIKCTQYTSSSGDVLYIHKQDLLTNIAYLGGTY